jgi:hypothetical protein
VIQVSMRRNAKLAACLFTLLTGVACHKKTLPPASTTPAVQAPAAGKEPAATQEPAAATKPAQTARRPRANPQPAPPPARASVPAAAPPQPEFRLGQALTPEEQRANNTSLDQHLRHATQALASIGDDRGLTQQQKALVPQIRGFIAQAQRMRNTDLAGARSLAEKADVLASDLAARHQ